MSAEDDMAWPVGTTVIPADPPSPLTCPECGASVICTNEPSKHAAAVTALASSPAPAGLDAQLLAAVRDWITFGAGDGTERDEETSRELLWRIVTAYNARAATRPAEEGKP